MVAQIRVDFTSDGGHHGYLTSFADCEVIPAPHVWEHSPRQVQLQLLESAGSKTLPPVDTGAVSPDHGLPFQRTRELAILELCRLI